MGEEGRREEDKEGKGKIKQVDGRSHQRKIIENVIAMLTVVVNHLPPVASNLFSVSIEELSSIMQAHCCQGTRQKFHSTRVRLY